MFRYRRHGEEIIVLVFQYLKDEGYGFLIGGST
jgi:hypothetical protein